MDRFEPATSYLTIATMSARRYFDLDAVRTPHAHDYSGFDPVATNGRGREFDRSGPKSRKQTERTVVANPMGAPPLDWWIVSAETIQAVHRRIVLAMCPERVCTTCGEPSRRVVDHERTFTGEGGGRSRGAGGHRGGAMAVHGDYEIVRDTVGWSICGHGTWRPGVVLAPFGGHAIEAAIGAGRDAVAISDDLTAVRYDHHTEPRSTEPMGTARYLIGDVRDVLDSDAVPDGSVDLVLTSPPFLALRSYLPDDHPDKWREIGAEATPAEFIDTMLDLTARWRRKLAPHGSIAVEFGDTYSGSGGAGGDYDENGMRAGQGRADGSAKARRDGRTETARPARTHRVGTREHREGKGGKYSVDEHVVPVKAGDGWPMGKSLCGIPHLYWMSLAYGFNLLTGEPSPAGMWRVRNVVAWCRPNPPVGELGDKFRPGTSYVTIATVAADRYFDLDAVRDGSVDAAKNAQYEARLGKADARDHARADVGLSSAEGFTGLNQGGTPPLDWWAISPESYRGSHYATWPRSLCLRPIKTMCPERVCLTCGEPSRRIVETKRVDAAGNEVVGDWNAHNYEPGKGYTGEQGSHSQASGEAVGTERTDRGWTHCACGDGCRATTWEIRRTPVLDDMGEPVLTKGGKPKLRRQRVAVDVGECHDPTHWRRGIVLDPFAGSGTTLAVATGCGRDALGIDLDERNLDLARERIGMFLEVDVWRPVETVNPSTVVA